jgi:hypothetical protein
MGAVSVIFGTSRLPVVGWQQTRVPGRPYNSIRMTTNLISAFITWNFAKAVFIPDNRK